MIIIKQNKSRKTSYLLFSILFLSCKNPCIRLVLTRSEIHVLTIVYTSDKRCINYQTKQINIPENDEFHTKKWRQFPLLSIANYEIILCTWFSWVKEWLFHLDVTLTFQGLLHTVETGSIEDIYYMLRNNLI